MPAPSLLLGIALGLVHGLAMVGLHHQTHGMALDGLSTALGPLTQPGASDLFPPSRCLHQT